MLSIIYSIRHTLFTYRFYYKYSLKNFPISYINKTPIFHSRKSVARGIGGEYLSGNYRHNVRRGDGTAGKGRSSV